jgi:uncharacterized protein with beta-barrel porin domain
MRKSTSKKKMLTAAVMTALLVTPGYSYAFKMAPEYVYYNGKPIAEMQFLAEGEGINNFVSQAEYTLSPSLIPPVKSSTAYWTGMIGPKAKNETPWQVFVTTEANQQNASAVTSSYVPGKGELRAVKTMFVPQQLQDGKKLLRMTKEIGESTNPPLGDYGFSIIYIGQYMGADRKGAIDGWWVDTDTVLPFNEQAADFVGTFRHELGHALGISKRFDYTEKPEAKGEYVIRFSSEVTDPDSWNLHLVDQNLNPAKPGMEILSAKGFAAKKNADPGVKERDYFIVNNDYKGEDASGKNGKAFFVGPHVTDALAGATFFGVNGVPVNSWEKDNFDGAHLQTAGMMSHRDYSNYTSFMEVELAVMQDLGYDIDREAYFGHSVYGDGLTLTNTQGYFARNEAGTAYIEGKPSTVPLGIGLHIYGSRNTVIQAADILTTGTGATGVRVDGMQNTVVVPVDTNIQVDGLRGNGILIAYGRDQVVNQAGTVTANGQGGTGIRFDFGSSSNGADDEYRGSYIRYKRSVEKGTGRITSSKNMKLTDMDEDVFNAAADELNGPQVTEYNLSGKLEGGEYAILISRNALVKEINVNEGASIKGDIVSDWKHFGTDGSYDAPDEANQALQIQYNENLYAYNAYIPDLVTDLNFNTDMTYSYDIIGRDNMKLNVNKGRLFYGGTADVVGVHVAEGATLFGGTYIVNDMTAYMAPGFSDDDTGVFHNCGTIGAASQDTSMQITGRLVSDGVLLGLAGGSAGHIEVSGSADISGSLLAAEGMLPGDTFTVLTATEGISGTPENNSEEAAYRLGLLNEIGTVSTDGAEAQVTAVAVNNLEGADAVQNETFDAMVAMSDALKVNQDPRREEMRPLFSLSPSEAKEALSSISANTSAKSMAVTQRSMMTHHILSSRLNEAFMPKPVKVELPSANLNDSAADGLAVSLNLLEPAENDIWFKFGKNWGDVQGDTDYHSSTTMLGYDKAVAPNWRVGAFAGYSSTSFADKTASNELKDTRFGLYAGYNKAGKEALLYLDYGWMRNKLRRGLVNLGLAANARYHSRILELGGEYLYDLHAAKNVPWHVRPYVNAQISRLWQDGYSEEGAGVFNQVVDRKHNDYFGMGAGVEFKRYLPGGNYAIRAGVRHAFAGAEPKLRYSYMGDAANTYDMRNVQDKTHFVLSIGGETQIAKGWTIGGDASFTRGSHDKDWSCAVTVKRMW